MKVVSTVIIGFDIFHDHVNGGELYFPYKGGCFVFVFSFSLVNVISTNLIFGLPFQ